MKKTFFGRFLTFFYPNSWRIWTKVLLNNVICLDLLHVNFCDIQSVLRLKSRGPNKKTTLLKWKISNFGWVHLKTAGSQLKKTYGNLSKVYSTFPQVFPRFLDHFGRVYTILKIKGQCKKNEIFDFFVCQFSKFFNCTLNAS